MKKLGLTLLTFALALAAGSGQAFGQAMPTSGATPPSSSYDLKARALVELQELQKQIVDLAQAVPAEKYTWRPADGVRSFSELFLHVAGGNFGLTAVAGAPPSPGFKFQGFEKSTTDKAAVIEQLNKSFDYARRSIEAMSDADLHKPLKFQDFKSSGDIVFHIVAHDHEHLGQSIAYARMNGVVPPWTAAAQKQGQPRPPQE
jgi:uncharacterized damage-inducible protein DinB